MTLASKITLVRVAFIPLFMVFMYQSGGVANVWMWLSLATFIIASLTDFVDGQIARRFNQVSDFGKFLDPLADKLLTIAAMVMFCEWGMMPGWALMLVLSREFAVTGLRLVAVGKGKVIAAGIEFLVPFHRNDLIAELGRKIVGIAACACVYCNYAVRIPEADYAFSHDRRTA